MTDAAKPFPGIVFVAIGLSGLILLIWFQQVLLLANLRSSDAAGNAIAQAYAAIATILVWVLLAVLVFLAWIKGAMRRIAAIAALVLVPVSGFVAFMAADLLIRPYVAPFLWPIMIPAAVPLLVIMFCFWVLLPSVRNAVPASIAAGVTWGGVFLLCASIVPFQLSRQRVVEQEIAAQEKYDADFARLPADAPLWDQVPFLATRNEVQKNVLLDRIKLLDRRQSDAEIMLDRGDFPLGYLGRIDLDPTPAICEKARNLLRKRVAPLMPKTPDSEPYMKVLYEVSDALAAMKWLVGYDCSCDAESLAWESMANAYRNPNFDVVELKELRDPKELGRTLREYPARFSMLSPKSHLKAWLRYADDKTLRERALAGARKLDHRTSDAIEMLSKDNDPSAPWTVLKYLPVLDLEPNAPFCAAALKQVRDDLTKVYRPRADDPRPYRELLDRLGVYQPLTALQWLAGHGCNAEAELSEAEAVVRTYQDSPERAAMLASLAQLHRK